MHPLDPLSGPELARAAEILRAERGLGDGVRFVEIALREPEKDELARHEAGEPLARQAFVVLLDSGTGMTSEALVSLSDGAVLSWTDVPGVQAAITSDEYVECERAVRADPRFRAALAERAIDDPDTVMAEAWTVGGHAAADEAGRRLAWTPCWYREHPHDNPYARPIEGLFAVVDLNTMEVLRVENHSSAPVPPASGDYRAAANEPLRDDLKPLDIVQPEGPSFEVDGYEVCWQKWRFRVGFTPREGLVLHQLAYREGDRWRSIVHRASYAEMVIPYGDPSPGRFRTNAYDIGEYGLGPITNSLELGCDCLGEIRYLDVDVHDSRGNPSTIGNAICLHEEDAGLLWKHYDWVTGEAEVRRSRRFVVSSIVTAANYEYAFYWYLYQDGTIEAEVKLTGIVLTSALEPGEEPGYGRRMTPTLSALNHQHFFCVRLDLAVDGTANDVHEVHTESVPAGPANPYGNAFRAVATKLRRESEAQQTIDPLAARIWRFSNPSVTNAVGEPVAYKLVPGANVLPFAAADSSNSVRAGFMARHFWVTPYAPRERYPAGDYPNQHAGGAGLPEWTKSDRSLEGENLVAWYVFGSHHVPRVEDWPVMPVVRIGFALMPDGFFDANPSLDVPPSAGHGAHCANHAAH
ncbi:MAG: primary-amine oxidase [Gaiellaceae bacterium]|nr:primary-amine oxidase [Gaiellaceae bacterium]